MPLAPTITHILSFRHRQRNPSVMQSNVNSKQHTPIQTLLIFILRMSVFDHISRVRVKYQIFLHNFYQKLRVHFRPHFFQMSIVVFRCQKNIRNNTKVRLIWVYGDLPDQNRGTKLTNTRYKKWGQKWILPFYYKLGYKVCRSLLNNANYHIMSAHMQIQTYCSIRLKCFK